MTQLQNTPANNKPRLASVVRLLHLYIAPYSAILQHLNLVYRLIRRDVVSRTSGTVLGGFWLLIQPALQVLAFWFLLDFVLQVRAPGHVGFLNYFLIAMLPWILVSETLNRNLGVLTEFSALFQKTLFPIEILPVLPLAMAVMVYAPIYAVVAGLVAGLAGFFKGWLIMVILTIWLLPFCYLLAIVGLFLKESRQIIPFLLTIVMYVTPILYQPEALPEYVKPFMALNLMADIIAIIEHWMYDLPLSMGNWSRPFIVWLLLAPPVWLLFLRAEPYMREEL